MNYIDPIEGLKGELDIVIPGIAILWLDVTAIESSCGEIAAAEYTFVEGELDVPVPGLEDEARLDRDACIELLNNGDAELFEGMLRVKVLAELNERAEALYADSVDVPF